VLPPKISTHYTTDKIVLPVGLGAPGGLKLGSTPYFYFWLICAEALFLLCCARRRWMR